jgi:hypothetical protein
MQTAAATGRVVLLSFVIAMQEADDSGSPVT